MNKEKLGQMEELLLNLGGTYILNHAKRVLHLSRLIAEKEGVTYNDDVLIFVSYFHDISVFPPYRPDGVYEHALESSKVVPAIAKNFEYSEDEIEIIVEAVKFHDKVNMGKHIETRLVRNADGIDYLGFMAVARDFSKQPNDMKKAVTMLKKRKDQFYSIIDYDSAIEIANPRLVELDTFISQFEIDSFGLY